jgi:hypothetical protein
MVASLGALVKDFSIDYFLSQQLDKTKIEQNKAQVQPTSIQSKPIEKSKSNKYIKLHSVFFSFIFLCPTFLCRYNASSTIFFEINLEFFSVAIADFFFSN